MSVSAASEIDGPTAGPTHPASAVRHMPQLDGLRALAVSAVLVHHFIEPPTSDLKLNWGRLGVQLFFVLSGFLITGILVRARDTVDKGGTRVGTVAKAFYIRRTLRIFPIYYLVMLLTLLFGPSDAKDQLPWLLTYTYNFWVASLGWFPEYFSHFWTLCVEEQFYLLWPWVILLAPRHRLAGIAVVGILAAPIFRWFVSTSDGFTWLAQWVMTPALMDSLGMGALLAIFSCGEPASATVERRLRYTALPAAIIGYCIAYGIGGVLLDVVVDTTTGLAFVWIVAAASRGFGGASGRLLELPPVQFVGRISYGIYVYHVLVLSVVASVVEEHGSSLSEWGCWGALVLTTLTLVVATVSWITFERPILRLKERFS
jgi:peptidoglycan/LPS O-acetylase OafA/YrhL